MLPSQQILSWQQFADLLANLPTETSPELKVCLDRAIELFEIQILPHSSDADLPDPIANKLRAYITESHRLLRLLPLDLMYLAAARTPTTLQSRQQAYRAKLTQLQQYCHEIVDRP